MSAAATRRRSQHLQPHHGLLGHLHMPVHTIRYDAERAGTYPLQSFLAALNGTDAGARTVRLIGRLRAGLAANGGGGGSDGRTPARTLKLARCLLTHLSAAPGAESTWAALRKWQSVEAEEGEGPNGGRVPRRSNPSSSLPRWAR